MIRTLIRRALIALCGIGLVTSGLAVAASPAGAAVSATAVTVPMTIDCAHLTASASGYARTHGYCATAGRATNAVSPANQVGGDCGTSYIYIDNYGGGNAHFRWGFNSTAGPVVYRSLEINWFNNRWGNWGSWPDSSFMAGSSYGNSRTVQTGSGSVEGDLTGSVTLWWGASCVLLVPTAVTTIS